LRANRFIFAFVLFALASLWTTSGFACDIGACLKETVPANGAVDVPVDAKIWIFFNTTPTPIGIPTLVEADSGQSILSSAELFEGGQTLNEVRNRVMVVEPFGGFLPDTNYRLELGVGWEPCASTPPTISFRTGSSSGAPAPTFEGLSAVNVACIDRTEPVTTCDDDSVFPRLHFTAAAAPGTDAIAYQLIRNNQIVSIHRELPGRFDILPQQASPMECFTLQALSLSGLNDGNTVEVCQSTLEATCRSVDEEDMGMESESDMGPTTDMGGSDMGISDMGIADLGVPDMDVADLAEDLPGGATDSSVGGCSCGTAGGSADGSLLLLLLAGLFGRVRRGFSRT